MYIILYSLYKLRNQWLIHAVILSHYRFMLLGHKSRRIRIRIIQI